MSSFSHHVYEPAAVPVLPTYYRPLSQNELSYFLPSRAYGLNDMMAQVIIRAPSHLVSLRRLRIAWAIMRLRHTLLACRIQMEPGCYDGARFEYTPPSSPRKAVEEAEEAAQLFTDRTGPEIIEAFLDLDKSPGLSATCISRADIAAAHVPVSSSSSPALHEYHLFVRMIHAVNDGLAVHQHCNMIVELMCGSATAGGRPNTDAELMHLLDLEWSMRWGQARLDPIIVPATEDRSPLPRSQLQKLAWAVDYENVKRRAIGGHVLPRIRSKTCKQVSMRKVFDTQETATILTVCNNRRVTLPNATFALSNLAWLRTLQAHPELSSGPKALPMMFYTAVSLRRHLPYISPLSSYMSLALGYANIVLPSFIPRSLDASKVFWHRANAAQSQMRAFGRSPMLLERSRLMAADRGARAKAFARMDDEADGTLPPSPAQQASQAPQQPSVNGSAVPSVALLGISCLGDLGTVYRATHYPAVQLVDTVAHTRKAKGGILMFTQVFNGEFSTFLGWDAAAFPPGVIEEFFGNYVQGVKEFILGEPSSSSVVPAKL